MPFIKRAQNKFFDFDLLMSSTKGHFSATMLFLIEKNDECHFWYGRKESVQVVFLQTHGEDGAHL